jgi:hypothetical protein
VKLPVFDDYITNFYQQKFQELSTKINHKLDNSFFFEGRGTAFKSAKWLQTAFLVLGFLYLDSSHFT